MSQPSNTSSAFCGVLHDGDRLDEAARSCRVTTLSFVNLLPELRKYGVSLTLCHQYIFQLEPEVRHAVFGNAGTIISFRVGAEDAHMMATELQPTFGTLDLVNLPNRDFYLKLMIDGAPSKPFSGRTLNQSGDGAGEVKRSPTIWHM